MYNFVHPSATVCEYFAHVECQDFAVPDCKENATYVPGKELTFVKHTVSPMLYARQIGGNTSHITPSYAIIAH